MVPVSLGDEVSAAGRPRRAVGSYPVAEGGRSPFEMARQGRFVTGILPLTVDQYTHHFLHHARSNSTCRAGGQFLCAAHVPAHRVSPELPLQTPRPDTPDSLPDPDAYFCPTLTEATTAPDGATRPLNVRILGWVIFPFTTSIMKL